MSTNLIDQIVEAILGADRSLANQLIDNWAVKKGYNGAIIEVISPVLDEIGNMYEQSGEVSLSQVYVAAKVSEDTLMKVPPQADDTTIVSPAKGPVVIGNIEDDFHPLGRKMVGIFLKAAGWKVYDLGIDVTPEEFISKALEVDARVIGASAMIFTTAMNIKKLRQEINNRNLQNHLQLAVGGGVFKLRPELVEEVGGDGTAKSASYAPALFDELWNASLKKGGKK